MESSFDRFTDALWSFAAAADAHTVIVIVFLTFLVRRTFWTRTGLTPASIVWVSMVLAFLLTPVFSTAPETSWGGQWFVRAALYNGGVAVGLWMLVMPMVVKKWPQLLKDDPIAQDSTPAQKPEGIE